MVSRRRPLLLLVCLCLTGYFGYHSLKGRHGLEARAELISRQQRLDVELARLVAVRTRLEREVRLLSEEAPDADLVEEIARDMLGFAYPGDRIILEARARRPQG
jgi:cell division protein FtsB